MTNNYISKDLQQKFSKRFKEERKKHHLSNRQLADILHYSDEHSISPFNSGKAILDERITILSKYYGLRFEYLKGLDDFPTVDDIFTSARIFDTEQYKNMMSLLELNGIKVIPCAFWAGSIYELYMCFDFLKKYIKDDVLKEYTDKYDFSVDETEAHFDDKKLEYIQLKSNPYNDMFDENKIDFSSMIEPKSFDIPDYYTGDIVVHFLISFNEKQTRIEFGQLKRFISHINSLIKVSADTLLLNDALQPDIMLLDEY